MSEKRYFFNVIEEMIQNPNYNGYCAGRVEVFDSKSDSGYAIYEARFLLPRELMESFRNTFDFKETDLPVMIRWEIPEDKKLD